MVKNEIYFKEIKKIKFRYERRLKNIIQKRDTKIKTNIYRKRFKIIKEKIC